MGVRILTFAAWLIVCAGCVKVWPPASPPKDYGLVAVPEENFTNGVGMLMVKTSDGYWVAAHEVTEGQYEEIRGNNPSPELRDFCAKGVDRSRLPVRLMTASQALKFCEKLTILESAGGKLPEGYVYSLPRECEWRSFVADAKLEDAVMPTRENPYWSTPEGKRQYAEWTAKGGSVLTQESFERPEEVGSRKPNRLGLYDVRGNVGEWCIDWHNPKTRASRVIRGGGYKTSLPSRWSIERRVGVRGPGSCDIGFRVVLVKQNERLGD